jgi:hypothetical protein
VRRAVAVVLNGGHAVFLRWRATRLRWQATWQRWSEGFREIFLQEWSYRRAIRQKLALFDHLLWMGLELDLRIRERRARLRGNEPGRR